MLKLIVRVQSVSRPDDAALPLIVNFTIMEGADPVGSFRLTGPQDGELGKLSLGSNHVFTPIDLNGDVEQQVADLTKQIVAEIAAARAMEHDRAASDAPPAGA